jgi:hypothetical protein
MKKDYSFALDSNRNHSTRRLREAQPGRGSKLVEMIDEALPLVNDEELEAVEKIYNR